MAAPGLLAWIITARYLDHLPLYRIAQIAARESVTLSLSTLAEWTGRIGVALQPLVDRLIRHVLRDSVLHADETPVAQLDPGSGKTHRATCKGIAVTTSNWGSVSSCSTTKPVAVANMRKTFSATGKAALSSTITPATNRCSRSPAVAPNSAAGQYVRRKFFELHQANASTVVFEALQRIGAHMPSKPKQNRSPPKHDNNRA